MSTKERVHVRPADPKDPKAQDQALDAFVQWAMECKREHEQRAKGK